MKKVKTFFNIHKSNCEKTNVENLIRKPKQSNQRFAVSRIGVLHFRHKRNDVIVVPIFHSVWCFVQYCLVFIFVLLVIDWSYCWFFFLNLTIYSDSLNASLSYLWFWVLEENVYCILKKKRFRNQKHSLCRQTIMHTRDIQKTIFKFSMRWKLKENIHHKQPNALKMQYTLSKSTKLTITDIQKYRHNSIYGVCLPSPF